MKSGDILGGLASTTNTVGKDNLKAAQANNNFYANIGVNLGFNKSSTKSNSHSV